MKRKETGQQLVLKTAVEFSESIRTYCDELERKGKRQITERLQKKATVTGSGLIQSPNIETLAGFIRESRMISDGKENGLGLLLCIYSGISADSERLIGDLESLNRIMTRR
ncbi:MAG: hypothetical protein ACHQEM_08475 [Chitinophagales bacterium]